MTEIKGFILDIDGTLLNSLPIHLKAWKYMLAQRNIFIADEEISRHFSKSTWQIAQIITYSSDVTLAKEMAQLKTDKFIELIPEIPMFPGVTETLLKIKDMGGKIMLASSNMNRVINKMMSVFNWNQICDGYLGTEDITHPKPHPEMIEKACKTLHIPPNECVMIGDSIYDIQAGKNAGTKTIAVCTGYINPSQFSVKNPDLILKQFSDLNRLLPLNF
jgi:HAD superfamily hydrolase (TIGR01662 family)